MPEGRDRRAGAGQLGSSHMGTQPSQAQPNGAATAERKSPCLVVGHTIAGNGPEEAWRPWWLSCGNAFSLAVWAGFPDPPIFPEKSGIQIWI